MVKMESFYHSFKLISPYLKQDLINQKSLEIMASICANFPGKFTHFWGLEFRIGEREPIGDILFEIKRESFGHFFLAGQSANLFDFLCVKGEIWSKLRHFSNDWLEKEDLAHNIRNIWLEFDSASLNDINEVNKILEYPSLFWGTYKKPITSECWKSIFQIMSSFHDVTLEAKLIYDFVQLLPESAHLFQLGIMISRSQPVIRLCVNHIPPRNIPDWLERIGWQGNSTALQKIINTLSSRLKSIAVDIDLTPNGLKEKIGLECYIGNWDDCSSEPWLEFLDILVELGLCLPTKREALLAYPCRRRITEDTMEVKRTGILYPILYQNIHHIKINIVNEHIQEAKAYLGVHRPGINYRNILMKSSEEQTPNQDSWVID